MTEKGLYTWFLKKEIDEIIILGVSLGNKGTQRWIPESPEKEEPAKEFGKETGPWFLCCSN